MVLRWGFTFPIQLAFTGAVGREVETLPFLLSVNLSFMVHLAKYSTLWSPQHCKLENKSGVSAARKMFAGKGGIL